MRSVVFSLVSFASLAALASVALFACDADDNSIPPSVYDAGEDAGPDATLPTDGGSEAAAPPAEAGGNDAPSDGPVDSGPVGPYLTVSYTFSSFAESGYNAFDLATGTAAGSVTYAQFGTNVSSNKSPWVLEQANDVVLQMDPLHPGTAISSWNVAEPAPEDGGYSYGDPFSVAEVGTKAYVALYTRDFIAVLDTSHATDGGAPLKSISLSQFVSDADVDRALEAIAVVYDAAQNLVWVVLGNTNQGADPSSGAYTTCTPGFHPIVAAIDPTTDTFVAGKTYALSGYDVYPNSAVAFDPAGDRLLVASGGCSVVTDDGGDDAGPNVGPTVESYVEELSLTTGTDTILLNPAPAGTGAIVYVDSTHAFLQSYGGVNVWDPTQTTLGPLVANAPDVIVWDGHGHLLGPKATSLTDGGTSFSIIATDPTDGGVTTLATNPFTPTPDPSSYTWEGVALWPHP